ncbi:MAG: hypothetical protein QMB65_04770, partial [Vicingaceae bacterium]
FSVPNNLYIIGTMNTADRSVEALDTALRRRFSFIEMMPDPSLLEEREVGGVLLRDLLSTMNARIEQLLDREKQIGHSYFFHVNNEADLAGVFNNSVIPLLQEHFYNDYEKIGLVLGKGMVSDSTEEGEKFKGFAEFKVEDSPEQRTIFRLNRMTSENIMEATELLLNRSK